MNKTKRGLFFMKHCVFRDMCLFEALRTKIECCWYLWHCLRFPVSILRPLWFTTHIWTYLIDTTDNNAYHLDRAKPHCLDDDDDDIVGWW